MMLKKDEFVMQNIGVINLAVEIHALTLTRLFFRHQTFSNRSIFFQEIKLSAERLLRLL